MQKHSPRISPLLPSEFSAEQKEAVGGWDVLNFSRVLARHPALYRAFVPLIEKVISRTELQPRDREILCLRVLSQTGETYELEHHETIARTKVGMSDAEIAAIKSDGQGLSSFDQVLIRAADELLRQQRIGDDTWQALAQRYATVELMEVVGLIGCYTMIAMVTKTFGIELEDAAETARQLEALRQYQ